MKQLLLRMAFLALCLWSAASPFLSASARRASALRATTFDFRWPSEIGGRPLQPLPLAPAEQAFVRDFPGAIAKFSDGERHYIIRYVTTPTRKLHSSADCFRGLGYRIKPEQPATDAQGAWWSCATAERDGISLRLRERITSVRSSRAWTDVSAWYWSAVRRPESGPWLAVTVVEE